jgi:hypothetical protein
MSTSRVDVIRCDGAEMRGDNPFDLVRCDARFAGEESEPLAVVRRRAKAAGWRRADGAWDYCPLHAGRG